MQDLRNSTVNIIKFLLDKDPTLTEPLFDCCLEQLKNIFGLNIPSRIYSDLIFSRKLLISNLILEQYKNTIQIGPFKGMILSGNSFWNKLDKGTMILGLYEKEILDQLAEISKTKKIFIDFGAADGYYGVGVLVNNIFEKSYVYEISEDGRKLIFENANLNNVVDKLIINGKADKETLRNIPLEQLKDSFLLCDIEGGEYDIFDAEVFKILRNTIIIIEIHENINSQSENFVLQLENNSKLTHTVSSFTTGNRNPNSIDFLKNFSDIDRWLICSEGRPYLMKWLRFDPIL